MSLTDLGPLDPLKDDLNLEAVRRNVRRGDILFCARDARGPLGIPFCRWVARYTGSEFSHGAIVTEVYGNTIRLLEVAQNGVTEVRFVDWVSLCLTPRFSVYRMTNQTLACRQLVYNAINYVLLKDGPYNFEFKPEKLAEHLDATSMCPPLYCFQAIALICNHGDPQTFSGDALKNLVPPWVYHLVRLVNPLARLRNCSLPTSGEVFVAGNRARGMLSSPYIEPIWEFELDR